MPASSWLLATFETDSSITVQTAASGGPIVVACPVGPLYLHDSTAARSYLTTLAAAILAACPSCLSVSFTLQQNRLIRVNFGAATSVTWGSGTDVRDALGFAGNLASGLAHTATLVSPFLWCPGMTEISESRLGTAGIPTFDLQIGGGGSFTKPKMTTHNYRVNNTLEWNNVANARVWVSGAGGEHYAFWIAALLAGKQFAHYRGLINDEASTTSVGLTGGARLGPYHWRPQSGAARYLYVRSIKNVEQRNDVSIPIVQVSEIE